MAKDGDSCLLHDAARIGNYEVVREILSINSENLNARDRLSRTPLHLAAWAGHADVVKLLCDGSADVGATAVDDMTAIHFASQRGHCEVVRILLASGAYVNVKNRKGMTALHFAVQGSKEQVAKFLIQKGASLSSINRAGKMPIDLVRDESMRELIKDAELERNARRSKVNKQTRVLGKEVASASNAAERGRDNAEVSRLITVPERPPVKPEVDTYASVNNLERTTEIEDTAEVSRLITECPPTIPDVDTDASVNYEQNNIDVTPVEVQDIAVKAEVKRTEVTEPKRKKVKVPLSHLSFDDPIEDEATDSMY